MQSSPTVSIHSPRRDPRKVTRESSPSLAALRFLDTPGLEDPLGLLHALGPLDVALVAAHPVEGEHRSRSRCELAALHPLDGAGLRQWLTADGGDALHEQVTGIASDEADSDGHTHARWPARAR